MWALTISPSMTVEDAEQAREPLLRSAAAYEALQTAEFVREQHRQTLEQLQQARGELGEHSWQVLQIAMEAITRIVDSSYQEDLSLWQTASVLGAAGVMLRGLEEAMQHMLGTASVMDADGEDGGES